MIKICKSWQEWWEENWNDRDRSLVPPDERAMASVWSESAWDARQAEIDIHKENATIALFYLLKIKRKMKDPKIDDLVDEAFERINSLLKKDPE